MSSGLAQYVYQRRTQLGLSRRELAERAALSYPYISQIETGEREPAIKAMHSLAAALEVHVQDLAAQSTPQDSTTTTASGRISAARPPTRTGDEDLERKLRASLRRRLAAVGPFERLQVLNDLTAETLNELADEQSRERPRG